MNAWRHGREIYIEKQKIKAEEKKAKEKEEKEQKEKEEKERKEKEEALKAEALKAEVHPFGKIEQKNIVKEENSTINIGEDSIQFQT